MAVVYMMQKMTLETAALERAIKTLAKKQTVIPGFKN